jgi:hypothetical protein
VRAAGGRSVDRPAAALSPEDGVAHHLPPLCASPLPSFRLHALPRALPPIRRESVAQAQRCVAKVTYSEPINKALGTSLLIPQVGRCRQGYLSIMHTTIPCSSRIESHRGPPAPHLPPGLGHSEVVSQLVNHLNRPDVHTEPVVQVTLLKILSKLYGSCCSAQRAVGSLPLRDHACRCDTSRRFVAAASSVLHQTCAQLHPQAATRCAPFAQV